MLTVSTTSRSSTQYIFMEEGGKIFLLYGGQRYLLAGIPQIYFGEKMIFTGFKCDFRSGVPSDTEITFVTSEVAKIEL